MATKYVEVDGYAVNYFHTGQTTLPTVVPDTHKGRLLLYVHGAGSNGHFAHKMMDILAGSHSPISFDFPGHGRSSGTESLKSVQAYSDFTYAFWKALALRPVVVVGHSMGGAIAMDLALRYSDMVEGLALTCTAPKFDIPAELIETWESVMKGRQGQPFNRASCSPKTPQEVVQQGWMEQIKTDPRVRCLDLIACQKVNLTDQLGDIKVRTLILAGEDDNTTPIGQAEVLRDGIPNAELSVIPDAGHWLPLEKPEEACEAIEGFLS